MQLDFHTSPDYSHLALLFVANLLLVRYEFDIPPLPRLHEFRACDPSFLTHLPIVLPTPNLLET